MIRLIALPLRIFRLPIYDASLSSAIGTHVATRNQLPPGFKPPQVGCCHHCKAAVVEDPGTLIFAVDGSSQLSRLPFAFATCLACVRLALKALAL
jgi:hypothetical protein